MRRKRIEPQMSRNKNIEDLINDGSIKNLADVDWGDETDFWNLDKAKKIIEKIQDKELIPAIIDTIIIQHRMRCRALRDIDFEKELDVFGVYVMCHECFDIENIKAGQTQAGKRIEKEVTFGENSLPAGLNTKEAKALLAQAVNVGLCDDNYKWLKSKALLAYFADRVSEYLDLGKGEYDGKAKTSWKPLESLFGISGLSGAKRDYQKTGKLPGGYKDVDNLFG